MSVAELPIPIDREQIARFCRERGIRKLSLFGSVLRPDFDPQRSDVDVLAEFEPGVLKQVGFRYFGYGQELAAIIGRKVDFCSRLHLLILGRCTSGSGGDLILAGAAEVLSREFPELAHLHIQLPDEKSRRVGQSIAAASLPALH